MNRCFDMGTPKLSSQEKTQTRRNRTLFQSFEDDVKTDIDTVNERNRDVRISKSKQVIFQNQTAHLQYTLGLYEDALACGNNDENCIFIDREGDGYGRENHLFELYQAPYTIQDTSGIVIDVSGELTWNLKYLQPLGMYYDQGCDRISNYLEYTTISGELPTRNNFNIKFPFPLHVE